jgi:hypothetical protein
MEEVGKKFLKKMLEMYHMSLIDFYIKESLIYYDIFNFNNVR